MSAIVAGMDANTKEILTDEVNSFAQLSPLELAEFDRWLDEVLENGETPGREGGKSPPF